MKIAHINENTYETQTVAEHSVATAEIASSFAFDELKSLIYNMGLLHDIGKYQQAFQDRILNNSQRRVEHAACGAIEFPKYVNSKFGLIAQYCIAGHHTGLPDGGNVSDDNSDATLMGRLSALNRFEDYSDYKEELFPIPLDDRKIIELFSCVGGNDRETFLECFAFLTRYCFSCLTDADSLDTAHFCNGREDIELESNFIECLTKINNRLEQFVCETSLQKARSELQKQVYEKTDVNADIYLMNMPTGSGKTLCSMKFALERAIKKGKKRIIYVIPYNSIIDQMVSVFESIFGDSASILRQQCSYCFDDVDLDENYRSHLKNAVENWNANIIVTTSVQFFESVYKNKRNRLRKLHNMADSIIVFDEVHMMPAEQLQPCLRAVSFITKLLNSEAAFLTATMPDFNTLVRTYALPSAIISELVTDTNDFACFKKADYIYEGKVSEETLINTCYEFPSCLLVVNKRKTALRLFNMATGKKFHLSTYMSAFDRQNTINQIKVELKQLYIDYPDLSNVPDDRRITVVSTSLIEAGVDLDFCTVYRELSGLDSILQAGGRCNREGKLNNAKVFIFELEQTSKEAKVNITKALLEEFEDISDIDCIKEYYKRLFAFYHDAIRKNTIADGCPAPQNLPFATYAQKFNIVESNAVSVAVERDDPSRELIERLKLYGYTNYRQLQKYTFTVYENELENLLKQGAAKEYGGVFCLTNNDYYSEATGVCFEAKDYFI